MKLSKIVLSLTVVFTFVACATQAQDNRSFNYNAMSKAQLQNRINNAKVEYKHAKAAMKYKQKIRKLSEQ